MGHVACMEKKRKAYRVLEGLGLYRRKIVKRILKK